MNIHLIALLAISGIFTTGAISPVFAQTIIVNETTPCFLNATAGIHMWEQCGADEDFISFALLPFEWITGGYFSMILVSTIILAVYIKYHKAIYSVAIGVVFIPIAFQFFPGQFWGFIIILVVLGVTGGLIWMVREQIRS